MGLGKLLAEVAAGSKTNTTQIVTATVVSVDGNGQIAVINIAGGTVNAQYVGTQPPIGAGVFVLLTDSVAVVLGAPGGPALGTVVDGTVNTTTDGDTVAVLGADGVVYPLFFPVDYEPTAGDKVLLSWEARGHIIMAVSGKAADPLDPNLPNPGGGGEREVIFRPSDSASWYSGRWNSTDVIFGQSYPSAGWFFGTQMQDTIPSGATILRVTGYVEVESSYGSSTAQMGTHAAASRPGAPMPISNLVDVGAVQAGFAGELLLPNAWGDLFKTGAAYGWGTTGSGFRQFRGAPRGSQHGALKIRWRD